MPQPIQNQYVPQSSTTPHSNPPQPNRQPDAFAQLAEEVATAQAFLNNPKSQKFSARHQPVRLAPQPDEPPRQASEKQIDASSASLLPQAAVDSPARSAVRSARAASHRPRVSSVRQAKNYLRVSRSPEFLNPNRSLDRHRRKCAICCHPEREMIEELFVRWHSPQAIANHLEDWDNVNWVSIYRHAYALGLDQVRRRNLRHFFENLLDDAINATPTFAGVLGAARALGCVTEDGRWVEPEKRILMTTVIRKEEPSSTTSTEPDVSSALPEQDVAPFASSMLEAAVNPPARSAVRPSRPASHRATRKAAPTDTAPPLQRKGARGHAAPVEADYDRPAFPRRASAAASPQSGHKLDEVSSASLLPQAAFDSPARSASCGSGLQPRQKARLKDASIRERLKGRGSASTPSLATCDSPVTNCEPQVASSTLLPQAAFDQPADASQTLPSGQPSAARRNESVAASATSLPEAAPHQPAAANRTPSGVPDPASLAPCVLASSSSREIRLPLNSHKSKEKTISNR